MNLFDAVRTYDDLINLNVLYIRGGTGRSPYYDNGESDNFFSNMTAESSSPDFTKVVEGLVKLNRLGFLTTNGQGIMDETVNIVLN